MNNALPVPVLDKGYVRLVDYMGTDASIIRSARVSHGNDHEVEYNPDLGLNDRDKKLLWYLWSHKHLTPFEACTVTFEIKAPIFVFRQWHRHRTQSYNEVSARYTELPDEFYLPEIENIGVQDTKNKQSRDISAPITRERREQLGAYSIACASAFHVYHLLLEGGWPRELARGVLPFSTYSRMYATMNLRNALAFLTLRDDEHAQWEIRVFATALKDLLETIFPETVACWERQKY